MSAGRCKTLGGAGCLLGIFDQSTALRCHKSGADTGDMAASQVLPTYQRYVNGVPVPQTRKTLRLREKYIVLLVFVTFGTVCFGAFFFLPDLRERVGSDHVQGVFVPQPEDDGSKKPFFHSPNEDDGHGHRDKQKEELNLKIQDAIRRNPDMVRPKTPLGNVSKSEHDKIKGIIEQEKDKLAKEKLEAEEKKLKEEQQKALDEVKDHKGHQGGQGGEPSDEETKKRRDKVKEVNTYRECGVGGCGGVK